MELNTLGTFNFRLVTNPTCQTTQLHLKLIFPSGRNCNTAAAKACAWVENTHIPNLSLIPLSSVSLSRPLPHSLWILSSSLILPEKERNETFIPKPRWWINWPWNQIQLIHDCKGVNLNSADSCWKKAFHTEGQKNKNGRKVYFFSLFNLDMTLSLEKNAFWIIDPNFLALRWQIQMAHYSLFGKQIVNINPSKDQWDSLEKRKILS